MAQMLVGLATRHDVALLVLRAPDEPPLDETIRQRCDLVEEFPRPPRNIGPAAKAIVSLLKRTPILVLDYKVTEYGRRVGTLARSWQPEIVQVEYPSMGQYLFTLHSCPAARILSDYDPAAATTGYRTPLPHGFARLKHHISTRAWQRFERATITQAQAVVVFTERDRRALTSLAGQTPIVVIPLGTQLPERPLDPVGSKPLSVLFVGNFIHAPNVDAARRVIREIFPRVQLQCPDATLHIVGDQPPVEIRQYERDHVVVTGRVPDVTPYLNQAAVVVAPLRQGGGMRVKVLEALAAGKAVVASRLALEGLDVVDGEHVLIAESDEEFTQAIVGLLNDPQRRESLASRAHRWARVNLGWERRIADYESLYTMLLDGRRPPKGT